MNPFLTTLLLLVILCIGLYIFVRVHPATLVRVIRTFIITFAGLGGLGLMLSGRIGLAIILISTAIMVVRAIRGGQSGGVGQFGTGYGPTSGQGQAGQSSEIVTDTLAMTLDHQTGDLEGEVFKG